MPSAGEVFIKGIATPALTINPAVGEARDRSNRKAMFWVAMRFLAGGGSYRACSFS